MRVLASRLGTRAILSPKPTLSPTVMCGKSAYDWKTVFTLRLCGGSRSTRSPRIQISPSVGATKPPIRLSVVVFPQPDGPRRQKNSPSAISIAVGSSARCVP